MTSYSIQAIRNPLLTLSAASITTSYVLVGTLVKSARKIKFKNNTNGALLLTYTLGEDMISLAEGEIDNDSITSLVPANGDIFNEPQGRTYYVKWKGSAPGSPTGDITIEYISASSGA